MSQKEGGWGFSTRAVHVGQGPDPATGAVVQPIHLATTFAQEAVGKHHGFEYSRSGNPTRQALEECLAALEEARHCLAFASGLGAESTLMLLLKPNDHVVYMEDVYGGTFRLFDKVMKRFGITFTAVDAADLDAVENAITPATRLVWLESPTNPLMRVVDIDAVSEVAHSHGARVCVDNTFATPYLQQPLHLGADVVVHSATKYIGGHSDVVGGAIMTSDDELEKQLRFHQNAVGAVPSPFDCWLLLRGIKTLALRVERQSENAMTVARALEANKAVSRVHYPGLESHANRSVAQRQMRMFGGMMSFEVKDEPAAFRVLERLTIFALAESLGAVESLAEHPARMTHASVPAAERKRVGVGDGLIRLSIGVEDAADLVADLEQALASSHA
ncbi:MAG: cystathionine gamma-synthase [Chloroflexi bacterium]|nr:MAG: cystathionine gamma-synthase [Chloroflexota bacterium]TME93662.1 MAG: cystathionine gamma-synthase [Chloroflexota bacterium]